MKRLELVTDGSSDPPGDRIDLILQFEPHETSAMVIIRGFKIFGDQNQSISPVGKPQEGGILGKHEFSRENDRPFQRCSIVIPYRNWILETGTHRIGYELSLLVDGRVTFVRPTPLSEVIVTDETRREMTIEETETRENIQERTQLVRLAGTRATQTEADFEVKESVLRTSVAESVTMRQPRTVEIPGEFIRRKIPSQQVKEKQSDQDDLLQSDAKELENRWWRPWSEVESETERHLWFATNRQKTDSERFEFTSDVSDRNHYGTCLVNIPIQNHRKGSLELPSWWSKRDPQKHFAVNQIQTIDDIPFRKNLQNGEIFLVIHGFNHTFEEAILRAAQLKQDLDFSGRTIAFCWPSTGNVTDYEADQKRADQSVDGLVELITRLSASGSNIEERGPKIHILAHSMGNRILLQALLKIREMKEESKLEVRFGQVILAAPDVGAIMFNNLVPHAVALSEQVTYYFCEHDTALNASRVVNRYEPVGLLPYFDQGLSTINANGVGTSFIGHGYYASSREVLTDIELLLKFGSPPPERMPPLATETKVFGHRCWAFQESKSERSRLKP